MCVVFFYYSKAATQDSLWCVLYDWCGQDGVMKLCFECDIVHCSVMQSIYTRADQYGVFETNTIQILDMSADTVNGKRPFQCGLCIDFALISLWKGTQGLLS